MHKIFFKKNLWVIALICILLVISFYDVIFLGKTFKLTTGNPQTLISGVYGQEENRPKFFFSQSTDVNTFEEPIYEFIKLSLREGILPLWNPHQGCGYPLISMIHIGMFWPLNFFLYILPQVIAWDVMILVRFLVAALLTYWFMRTLKFGAIPSLGSAIIFMLSGPMLLQQYSFANVEILVPLLLLSYEKIIKNPHPRTCSLAAVSLACTCIAGNPEHTFLVNVFGFLYFIFRLLTVKSIPNRGKTILYTLLAYVMATGLSAFVLLPFLRDWVTEIWHTHSPQLGSFVEGYTLRLETLLCFLIPNFFQKVPVTMNFTRYTSLGHIGIFAFGLAFLSLFSRERRGLNFFFVFSAFAIYAKNYLKLPFINWIGYLPLFRDVRFYLHTHHLFAFALSIAAGMGIQLILSNKKVFRKGLIFSGIFLLLVGSSLYYFRNRPHLPQSLQASLLGLGILIVFQGFLLLKDKDFLKNRTLAYSLIGLIFLELFLYIPRGHVNRFDSFPAVPYVEYIKSSQPRERVFGVFWTLLPNTATGYRIDDLGIEEGLFSKRFVRYINNLIRKDFFRKVSASKVHVDYGVSAFRITPFTFNADIRPFLDLLNVRYSIAPKKLSRLFIPAKHERFPKPFYDKEVKIYEHPKAFPRAFIVHRAIFHPDEKLLFEAIKKLKDMNRAIIVLLHENIPEIVEELSRTPILDGSYAEITKYSPNEVVIEADVKNKGFLVLGDTYHPDWKAYVGGKETKIYCADYLLRAVYLPEGKHTVRFVFKPFFFYVGILVTLLSLLIIILLSIIGSPRPSRRRHSVGGKRAPRKK